MRGKLDCFGLTDVGQKREVNQDQFVIADLNKSMQVHQTSLSIDDQTRLFGKSEGRLLAVADGMGGHASGERASTVVVDGMIRFILNTLPWMYRIDEDCEPDFFEELKNSLIFVQHELDDEMLRMPERAGMGSTLTMAYISWPQLYVIHVGDSRCYLLRDDHIEQITHDHTVAQQMVEKGAMTEEEASHSRLSHMLWNVLGGSDHTVRPEAHKATLELGDQLVLCSDGLTNHVTDDQIASIVKKSPSAKKAAEQLIQTANANGGSDNITVIVARFVDMEQSQSAMQESVAEPEPADQSERPTQPMKAPTV